MKQMLIWRTDGGILRLRHLREGVAMDADKVEAVCA
jgi:hypothetical protein